MARLHYTEINGIKITDSAEQQADQFARRILCPACVLWALELNSSEQIAKYCRVELSMARSRFERMKILNKRGKYLTSPLEKEIFLQFEDYIESERLKRVTEEDVLKQ